MKKITTAIAAALVVICTAACVFGATIPRLRDNAKLIDPEAGKTIAARFDEISRAHKCDVAVVIDDAFDGEGTEQEYKRLVDEGAYGFKDTGRSIVLVIGMAPERGAFIGTSGFDRDLTEEELYAIAEPTFKELSKEDFAAAAKAFGEAAAQQLAAMKD